MLRLLPFFLIFLSNIALAKPPTNLYQVDIILFTHSHIDLAKDSDSQLSLLPPDTGHSIPLQTTIKNKRMPYHLLPSSASHLQDEYWALTHKSGYQVLFHYSWLQPSNSQTPVALSQLNVKGWNIEGIIDIRQHNYYSLETHLLFTLPENTASGFLLSLKQRLKPNKVYYLDHPQAGMLISVHQ